MWMRGENGTAVEIEPEEVARVLKAYATHKECGGEAPSAETVEPVTKRSTGLYLSAGALRALRTIAANQGMRPHRAIDDALRAEFKRHGLNFDALNAIA
ncbi:hypothetical protein ACRAWG_21615 [Methylobacterium sp. P31]